MLSAVAVCCCRFGFVEGITSGTEDGTDSLPHLTNVKPDPEGPSKPPAGEATCCHGLKLWDCKQATHERFLVDQAYSCSFSVHDACIALFATCVSSNVGMVLALPLVTTNCPLLLLLLSAERVPQPADEGGQLQLQLLDPDKSEQQPLGLEPGFQDYLR